MLAEGSIMPKAGLELNNILVSGLVPLSTTENWLLVVSARLKLIQQFVG